jgi:hypothetical protein
LPFDCRRTLCTFLNYLDLTRDQNDLNTNIVVSDFLSGELKDFSRERIFNENGVSIRHLNGIEVEALEMGCTDTNDWILGAMAITIGCDKLPPIDMPTSIEFCGRMIKSRMTLLEGLEKTSLTTLWPSILCCKVIKCIWSILHSTRALS